MQPVVQQLTCVMLSTKWPSSWRVAAAYKLNTLVKTVVTVCIVLQQTHTFSTWDLVIGDWF